MADKIKRIRVGKNLVGFQGLEEVFQEVGRRSWESVSQTQEELLRLVAAKNYIPPGSREAYRQALWREFCRFRGEEVEPEPTGLLEITVLGLGCQSCQHFYQQVVDILAARQIKANLQYITDLELLKESGVRAFPALLLNGQVALAGRLPAPPELERILMDAARGRESR